MLTVAFQKPQHLLLLRKGFLRREADRLSEPFIAFNGFPVVPGGPNNVSGGLSGMPPANNIPDVHDACRSIRHRASRSEEHTSELQSLRHLVCRLLLEK